MFPQSFLSITHGQEQLFASIFYWDNIFEKHQ